MADSERAAPGLDRRHFLAWLGAAACGGMLGCRDSERYGEADERALERQRREERASSGKGPYGVHRYAGYRGLAELPYFELDQAGHLRCIVDDLPSVFDIHCHLGMSLLFAPEVDLQRTTDRVEHLLDCDAERPGCPLDLDVYINANFRSEDLRALRLGSVAQLFWGSRAAQTQTIPNLLAEMDATRVERAMILPIAFGLPFGDDLADRWHAAIDEAGAGERLIKGASVHPRDPGASDALRAQAARGARLVKLHPAGQRFFPDAPEMHAIYRTCDELGLPIIFHGGRAGIEPGYTHQFTLMRHYEGAFRAFPNVQFVLAHAGARDVADAIPLAGRHDNVWLGIHGQGITRLAQLIDEVGADRLLFGTDWPFYHLAATLAKVLIVTEGQEQARRAILADNADRLLSGPAPSR